MALNDAIAHLGFKKTIATSAASTDAAEIDVPVHSFRVTHVTIYNATGNNSLATLGVFTGAGGTGATIVANAALTSHTASTVVSESTVAATALTPRVTADKLYIRVGTASGVAGSTVDVIIHGYAIP